MKDHQGFITSLFFMFVVMFPLVGIIVGIYKNRRDDEKEVERKRKIHEKYKIEIQKIRDKYKSLN